MRERHAPGELGVVGVAGEERPGRRVELCDHVERLALAGRAQDPLVVGEHAEARGTPLSLVSVSTRELDRVARVHEDVELVADAVRHPRRSG